MRLSFFSFFFSSSNIIIYNAGMYKVSVLRETSHNVTLDSFPFRCE